DLGPLGIIDKVIEEPPSGAQSDPDKAAETVKREIMAALEELKQLPVDQLLAERLQKYRRMGVYGE
ncbi:MAG: acetyl-CoA carboxylase carboxyl transferase subunit alpha, partial [candidate division Zixibacteria bacterium]|nr:acetyl-CoA carboxylase carboxyl transferase subunit alpha [candidate division Zixibacteria bacterium]